MSTRTALRFRPSFSILPAFLSVLLAVPAVRAAGEDSGQLRGSVTDPTGAVVPGVRVTASRGGAGTVRDTVSASDGGYVLSGLSAGPYQLVAEMPGFERFVRDGIAVEAGAEEQVDIRLELGGFAETVTASEPGNFTITAKEIALVQAQDKASLLSNESMVAVGGGSQVAQKIYVRGFEDTLLNVTVDGAQQAGELYHHQGRVQIEPEFLKAIDLEAGAGPATSGAGALTGALRLTTKDAFDLLRPDQRVGMLVKGTGDFNGDDVLAGLVSLYGRLSPDVGLVVTALKRDGGDYRDGNGDLVTPTAFDSERGHARLDGVFGSHRASVSYEHLDDFGTYFERPNLSNFTGTFVLSDHDMTRDTLSYKHRYDPPSARADVQGTLYWTRSEFENRRNTTGALYGAGDFSSLGLDLRNTARLGDNVLVGGLEYRRDVSYGRQQATPPPFWGSSDQSARVFGLYVQDDWRALPSLLLSGGLRFDAYHHSVDEGVGAGAENEDGGFSPNASITWNPVRGVTLRSSYAVAFRGITIREAFFSGLYVHRGDLESERADNLELGVALERGPAFVRGTLFRQEIDNYINAVYHGTTAWGYWENVGDAKVEGYEVEVGARTTHFRVSAGVWDSENTLNGRPMTDADLGLGTSIGRTWLARADWTPPGRRLTLGLRARLVEDEPNAIGANAPGKDGYAVADLHAAWAPLASQAVTLNASVTNLFDEFYYDQATYTYNAAGVRLGFPAKGRAVVFSASYRF